MARHGNTGAGADGMLEPKAESRKSHLSQAQEDALEKILGRQDEGLTAGELLQTVKRSGPNNPLHALFEWDDDTAAHEYRLVQARWILRKSRFKFKTKGSLDPLDIRRVMHVEVSPGREAFLPTEQALRHKRYRDQLEAQCRTDFRNWYRKWRDLLGEPTVHVVMEERDGE